MRERREVQEMLRAGRAGPLGGHPAVWESLASLSSALAGLKEVRRFRVYADVRDDESLKAEIENFCHKAMA